MKIYKILKYQKDTQDNKPLGNNNFVKEQVRNWDLHIEPLPFELDAICISCLEIIYVFTSSIKR